MTKDRFNKLIRVVTVAPLLASAMLLVIRILRPAVFPTVWHLAYSLFFLGALPLLAYPLQRYFPRYKDRGREGQRSLAIVFAVSGYILGCAVNLISRPSDGLWVIFLGYLISGLLIFVFNRLFHVMLSGHACGIFGPIMLLLYFKLYAAAAAGLALSVAVFISSIQMKRHTAWQLIGGSLVPVVTVLALGAFF